MDLVETNWKLIRQRYEMLGQTTEELAQEFGLSHALVEAAAQREGWKRRNLKDVLHTLQTEGPEASDFENIRELMVDKYALREIMKDEALQGSFHVLEAVFLGKTVEVIQSIEASENFAAGQLETVARAMRTFYELSKSNVRVSENEGGQSNNLNINIMAHAS